MKRLWIGPVVMVLASACSTTMVPPAPPTATEPRLAAEVASPAEQARAAERLAEARAALEAGRNEEARRLAEEVVREYPGSTSSVPALLVAGRAALRLGDVAAAAAHADRYAGVFPSNSPAAEEGRALAAEARGALAARPHPVLGAILPQSGSDGLRQYGDLILEGIRLAVDGYNRDRNAAVELVVLDDAGNSERGSAHIRELERRGAFGVIGPLLVPGVIAAAQSRSDASLAIVSPLQDMTPWRLPQVFSLSSMDTRGAEVLAEYAAGSGLLRVAMLYPRMREFEQQAAAFAAALTRAGGRIVADVPYDSGTTTFADPMRRLGTGSPQALFIPAPERDIRQIAPQLLYYGLRAQGLQILGGEAWANDELLRLIDAQHVEGVIAATPFYRGDGALEWSEFVRRYETTHRRTLDNPIPALGYDAARLLLSALGDDPRPAAVSSRIAAIVGFRSATGVLSIRNGEVERMPFLVRIQARELVPIRLSTGG